MVTTISAPVDFDEMVVIVQPPDPEEAENLFYELCRENPDRKMEQDTDGNIYFMPPAGNTTSDRNAEIIMQLRLWSKKDGRGKAYDSNTIFVLPDGSKRSPDAAWVSKKLRASAQWSEDPAFMKVAPEFIIELKSKSDRFPKLRNKCREWIRNGTQLAWLIDPPTRTVEIYSASEAEGVTSSVLTNPDIVSASAPLEGFVLEMHDIWNVD